MDREADETSFAEEEVKEITHQTGSGEQAKTKVTILTWENNDAVEESRETPGPSNARTSKQKQKEPKRRSKREKEIQFVREVPVKERSYYHGGHRGNKGKHRSQPVQRVKPYRWNKSVPTSQYRDYGNRTYEPWNSAYGNSYDQWNSANQYQKNPSRFSPGDWVCCSCGLVNFRRNLHCLDCKQPNPARLSIRHRGVQTNVTFMDEGTSSTNSSTATEDNYMECEGK